jgi:hypothetical protein
MSSMQTRLAQGAARDADRKWKQHAAGCARCSRLSRNRSAEPCGPGAELRSEAQLLRAEARRQAALDKAPNPDQGTLI